MKNKKLSLNGLKVKSFVTDLHATDADTVKGGVTGSICTITGTIQASIKTDIGCCPDA